MTWLRWPARRGATPLLDAQRHAYEQRIAKLDRELQRTRDRLDRHERLQKEELPVVALDYADAAIKLDASTKLARKRRTAATKEPFTVQWIESSRPGRCSMAWARTSAPTP